MVWPPTGDVLDAMRHRGDPPADERVRRILDREGVGGVERIMHTLVVEELLPGEELQQLAHFDADHETDPATIRRGQRVFEEHGPEILWVLGCYSLPSAFASANGVEVLAQTNFLTQQTNRRLIETSQMVVDVLTEGGLNQGGRGTTTIEKVRLMHAAIRILVTRRTDQVWDADRLGVPINQEDLAGTLMTFSYLAVDGLKKLGIRLTREEREAYLATWFHIGRQMGLTPDLIPTDFRSAKQLTKAIQDRQIRPTATGREMLIPLLATLDSKSLPGVAAASMRRCLPRRVADGLGVPRQPLLDFFLLVGTWVIGVADRWLVRVKGRSGIYRRVGMLLVGELLLRQRGGSRPNFALPDSLDWYHAETRTARTFTTAAARLGARYED